MQRTGQLVPQHGQGYLGNIHTHSRTVGSLLDKDFSETSRRKYQPSGEGGTRSPPATPATSKMADRGPQNGQRGLERC